MPATAEGWHGLLGSLTEEELAQYKALAADQVRRETRWSWMHGLLLALATAALIWSGVFAMSQGLGRPALYGLGLSGVLGYWPWRSLRTQRLWRGHEAAVAAEMERRLGTGR